MSAFPKRRSAGNSLLVFNFGITEAASVQVCRTVFRQLPTLEDSLIVEKINFLLITAHGRCAAL